LKIDVEEDVHESEPDSNEGEHESVHEVDKEVSDQENNENEQEDDESEQEDDFNESDFNVDEAYMLIIASDNETEDSIRKHKLRKLKRLNESIDGKPHKISFYVGQIFYLREEVKKAIRKHIVETRRKMQLIKNDNERVRAACNEVCPIYRSGHKKIVLAGNDYCGVKINENKGVKEPVMKCKDVKWKGIKGNDVNWKGVKGKDVKRKAC
ncbi:transposase, MuDR, partial [Tanacetum coccineum]